MIRFRLGILILCLTLAAGCIHFKNSQPVESEASSETVVSESMVAPSPTPTATVTPMLSLVPDPTLPPTAIPTPVPVKADNESTGEQELIQLNFEDASLREILEFLAELAEWDYLISPEVGSGSVTLRTSTPFKKSEIEKVLYSLLDVNNLAIVEGPRGDDGRPLFKKIIPKPHAKHSPITTRKGKDLSLIPWDDVVVTQIIKTEYVSPDEILSVIQPLISPDANIITHPGANMMIITDTSSNIRRVLEILALLDRETALLELEIYQVQYADVQDIVSVLDSVLTAKVSIGGTAPRAKQTRNVRDRRPSKPATSSTGGVGPIMIPDTRSNSLIVFALRKDLEFIREIISILDVDIYVTRKAYIYFVENAKAADMANLLAAVYTGQENSGRATRRTTSSRPPAKTKGGAAATIGGASEVHGEVSIVADERTNALIIVTAPVNYPFIVETIEKLDIMPKQVLIEVLIADVTLDEGSEMGISWSLRNEGSMDVGGDTYYFDGTANQFVGGPNGGFEYQLYEASRFKAVLSAKANENKLEILSSPHILVANNMEATIDIGSDIPVVTREEDLGLDASGNRRFDQTIEYRTTGILLSVIPHINSARYVNLELTQEVSNLSEKALEGVNSPIIETRKATTTVMVKDNQTLVIGGLIQRTKNPSREGVPWIYKVPILKYIFGKHKYTERSSELLIFLTPHVVESPSEASELSEKVRRKINIDESFYNNFIGVDGKR